MAISRRGGKTSDTDTVPSGPDHPEKALDGPWKQWKLAWFALFYLLLTYAGVGAAVNARSVGGLAVRLLEVLALGGWYFYWIVVVTGRAGLERRTMLLYATGAGALWLALIVTDPAFVILGFGILGPFCLHHLRWSLAVTVLVAAGWALQGIRQNADVSWSEIVLMLLLVLAVVILTGYVRAVARESKERQQLIEQLHATRAELAAAERQAGTLEERQRLARDIHDTLTQGFASIAMLLEAARGSLAKGDLESARHIDQALRSAREHMAESRDVMWALRPDSLCRVSLPEALSQLTARLSEQTWVHAETVVTGTPYPLGIEEETALLRVAQETLANVRKHAEAKRVTVTISYMQCATALDIQDDGVGFDPAQWNGEGSRLGGLGLRAMRERMESIGGTLVIESTPGEGTTVAAELATGPAAAPHLRRDGIGSR
ncbi:MAG TPA: sensor histidine kinase [Actinomycetota bacterium]|nr:sensor histidine kinase [Actinomycetota bacterium]